MKFKTVTPEKYLENQVFETIHAKSYGTPQDNI